MVTAQELRQDVKKQARREAKLLEKEARGRVQAMLAESEKLLTEHRAALQELERQRERFLKAFRTLLERELDTVEVEFGRAPLEDVTVDLELGKGSWSIGEDEDDDQDEDEEEDDEEDDQENPPSAASDVAEAKGGEKTEGHQQASEGDEGDDSLWLSSIMKDEDAK